MYKNINSKQDVEETGHTTGGKWLRVDHKQSTPIENIRKLKF